MISTIFSNIPWYIYLILYILVKKGIIALKDQEIPVEKIFIFPLIMVIWAFYDIYDIFGITSQTFTAIFCGLAIGTIFGLKMTKGKVFYVSKERLLYKGSPFILIMILAIFTFKVTIFTILGFNPTLTNNALFAILFALSFSMLAGITIGKLIYALNILKLKQVNNIIYQSLP